MAAPQHILVLLDIDILIGSSGYIAIVKDT